MGPRESPSGTPAAGEPQLPAAVLQTKQPAPHQPMGRLASSKWCMLEMIVIVILTLYW